MSQWEMVDDGNRIGTCWFVTSEQGMRYAYHVPFDFEYKSNGKDVSWCNEDKALIAKEVVLMAKGTRGKWVRTLPKLPKEVKGIEYDALLELTRKADRLAMAIIHVV